MRKGRWAKALSILGIFAAFSVSISPNAQALPSRSLIDRTDDVLGPQIHLIYLIAKDVQDQNWDTSGQIKKWVDQSQDWFSSAGGKKFRYDTFSGDLDISFLKSQLSLSEMRTGASTTIYNSQLLPYLIKEFITQSPQKNYSSAPKTYIFVTSEVIDSGSCGFANFNIGGIIWGAGNCWKGPQDDSTSPYGMAYPARAIIHEAIHVYGVKHVCDSTADLMWGVPECEGSVSYSATLLDVGRNDYFGSERAGVDIARLPVWMDGPTTSTYSTVKAIKTYAPYSTPADGSKGDWIFKVGKESTLSWEWERIFGLQVGTLMECTLSNGKATLTAQIKENQCVFEVPLNWRGGVTAQATGKIWVGPYSGSTTENIKIWNPENGYSACTDKYCFVGETINLSSNFCYSSGAQSFTLQQFADGQWKNVATTSTQPTDKCKDKSWEPIPVKFTFNQSGPFTYRWVQSDSGNVRGFTEPVKVISILASDANYPVAAKKDEVDKEAEALAALATKKAEEDRLARELYSRQLSQCATSATNCYVGESFVVPALCFYDDIGAVQLEILKGTTWEILAQGKVAPRNSGCSGATFGTPSFSTIFTEVGVKVLRWRAAPGSKSIYISGSYGILITDKSAGEPSSSDLALAQSTAETLTKEVDRLAAEAAAKAAADKKKTTITCVKGKLIKKVTAIKPVCPKGFTKKK